MNYRISILLFFVIISTSVFSQEILFTNYFDIEVNKKEGSLVFGKVNLKSNKNFLTSTIPKTYKFSIDKSECELFTIETEFDTKGRVFGILKVASGKKTPKTPTDVSLKVVLKDRNNTIASKDIVIHIVKKTIWQELVDVYTPITIATSRLYGRKKISDKQLENLLNDIESNDGKFSFSSFYTKHPSDYKSVKVFDKDLENLANTIGGLGLAYAKSKKYGLKGDDSKSRQRLKKAIYATSIAFMNSVPIYGKDVIVNGKPIGTEVGDGFSKLGDYASHGLLTHQWRATDALAAPLVHVWPEVLEDIQNGDNEAQQLYNSVIRYYQLFFSIVPSRRVMNDKSQRWKNISDVNYSEGAWADANIGHRMRTLMVMPILWADYNRPITYVPYWYNDYYNGTEFEGMTFADNWSPNGVVADVRSWCDKLSLPTHIYNQSGFHPDGTVTHHIGHKASDVAMVAYGFEWLTTVNTAIDYFKNTPMPLNNKNYQFITDRFNYTYKRMLYKDGLDYVIAGRSFFSDLSDFGTSHLNKAIKKIIDGKSPTTIIKNELELKELKKNLTQNTNFHTETVSFWNADYLIHRKEEATENYFFSVKHKSVRTSGAEDFSKIKKSWHAASGVFQLKVDGDEYTQEVLANYDWHTLPGVTEEWNPNPFPKVKQASASMPGGNNFSGILSNGSEGLTGYHHKPIDNYTSTEALKSYHLIGRYGTAIGSGIKRKSSSERLSEIVTCIDQSKHSNTIYYSVNGVESSIKKGESVNLKIALTSPSWIHHKNKGYLIFPSKNQNLLIKTGAEINITATDLGIKKSSNYIFALDHGVNPTQGEKDKYHYVLVANTTKNEMPTLLENYRKNYKQKTVENTFHLLIDSENKIDQVVYYKPSKVTIETNRWLEVDKPVLVMVKDLGDKIQFSVTDPLHSLKNAKITIKTSEILKEGTYNYKFQGIKPREGETAIVTSSNNSSTIVISLPDETDGEYYNYQEQMYAGAPVILWINKK